MDMLKVLILICATQVARGDCNAATANSVLIGPQSSNLMICGFHGQGYLAGLAIARELDGQYVKIVCRPQRTREARSPGQPSRRSP